MSDIETNEMVTVRLKRADHWIVAELRGPRSHVRRYLDSVSDMIEERQGTVFEVHVEYSNVSF